MCKCANDVSNNLSVNFPNYPVVILFTPKLFYDSFVFIVESVEGAFILFEEFQ